MNRSYRKFRHIIESNQILENRNINRKNLLFENTITVLDRKVMINPDGTVSFENKKKEFKKIEFGINVGSYQKLRIESFNEGLKEGSEGYYIKMKNFEKEKFLNQDQLNDILTFVDSDLTNGVVESESYFTPNLNMTKL